MPPGAKWTLLLLLGINLFNYVDRFVLAAVVPRLKEQFHASDKQVGALATAFLVSYMVLAPVFGWLADRWGKWTLIGVGVLIWSVASGASGLAAGIGAMLLTRVFVGVGEAAYGPTAPAVISDMYPVDHRGRALAWFYAAIPVGSALGYLLGGLVLTATERWHWFAWSGYTWQWAFFLVVPPGLLLGLLSFFMRDPPPGVADRGATDAPPRHAKLADYWILFRTPSYVLNTLGMTAMTFAMGGVAFWMPTYIVWHSHETISLDRANAIFGPVIVVSGLAGTLAGGAAGDWLRSRWSGSYFLVSGAAMTLAFPMFYFLTITPFPAAWALIFVASFCLFFNTGPTNTILANVTHPALRPAAFALNILIIHALGDAISPALIGGINDVSGGNMNAGFVAVSITTLIGGLCWLWAARYLARDTELAPTRIGSM